MHRELTAKPIQERLATLSDILQRLTLIFRTDEKAKVGCAIRPTNRSDDAKERNKSLGGGLKRGYFLRVTKIRIFPKNALPLKITFTSINKYSTQVGSRSLRLSIN